MNVRKTGTISYSTVIRDRQQIISLFQDSGSYSRTRTHIPGKGILFQDKGSYSRTRTHFPGQGLIFTGQGLIFQDRDSYSRTRTYIPGQGLIFQDTDSYSRTRTHIPGHELGSVWFLRFYKVVENLKWNLTWIKLSITNNYVQSYEVCLAFKMLRLILKEITRIRNPAKYKWLGAKKVRKLWQIFFPFL